MQEVLSSHSHLKRRGGLCCVPGRFYTHYNVHIQLVAIYLYPSSRKLKVLTAWFTHHVMHLLSLADSTHVHITAGSSFVSEGTACTSGLVCLFVVHCTQTSSSVFSTVSSFYPIVYNSTHRPPPSSILDSGASLRSLLYRQD